VHDPHFFNQTLAFNSMKVELLTFNQVTVLLRKNAPCGRMPTGPTVQVQQVGHELVAFQGLE
jgi:hypothetical protein